MADFTTADLEGANELLNKTLTDALALKDQLVAQHGADATQILNALQSKVSDLESSLSNMIPELPTVPNVNMQGEFATLANFDISTPQGLEQYTTQVSNIQSQFGTAMTDKGLDIDSLATQIQAGGDVGDLLPNLQLPDGETLPIELPANVSLPSKESIVETINKVSKDGTKLTTTEIEVITDEAPGFTKVTTTKTTTTTTNPTKVTDTSTNEIVKISDTGGGSSKYSASTINREEEEKEYRERKLAEYKRERTIIPGFFEDKTYNGVPLPIQRYPDKRINKLFQRANGFTLTEDGTRVYDDKFLSKAKTLRYFTSATYEKNLANGMEEEKAFEDAQWDGADWEWKKDDKGYIKYDRRYKKRRLT